MAKNDWTVVSETPATEASSWTVVSETPVGPVDYKKLESTGAEPVDYSAAATAMEGTPAGERERKVYTGSIFDTIKLPEPQFDPVEAARLSRKSEAERTVGLLAPRPRTQVAAPIPPEQLQRTTGEAIKDSVIDILQGSAGLGKSITANLLAGDNPLTEFFESSIEAGERAKSPFLRNQAAKRAALIQNIAREQGELAAARAVFQQSFSPAGASVILQGGGSLIPTVGMSLAGLSLKALTATNMLATAGESAQQTVQALTRIAPEQWSQNDVYQDLREKGLSHRDAVKILAPLYALPSQATGLVTGAISGSTGLERALTGAAARGARARLGRAGAELAGEELETLGPKAAENIARAMAGEDIGITAGMGQAAAETAMGSVPGSALAAAITGPGAPAPRIPSAAQMARERGFGAEQWEVVSEEPITPPAAGPAAAAPTVRAEIPAQQRAVEELEREMEREAPIEAPITEVAEPLALEAPAAEPTVAEEPTEPPTEPLEIEPLPEQLAGEPMPKTPEVVDAERILDEMYAERDKIEEQKVGSLWAKVKGRLADSDVKDIGNKKRYTFLRAGKQKAPMTIADMVADGTLDAWLPFDMRHDAPNFDGQVSEEYIKDKLRNGDYTNFERRMAIDQIMDQAESYERLINEEFTLEEINREIQLAVDEQRQIDQALEEPAAQRPAAPVVSRAEVEEFLKAPTEAGLRQEAEMRARAEREAARVEAAPPPEEFTLTGSERAADEAAARGQRELTEEPEQPPLLDVTGQPEMKGRHPQVVAAGRLFKEGKMAREDFEKYVDYYTPIREVEADKLYEPASEERIREALREGDKPFLGVPIADGTRVGLRMDIPSLRKGVPVVSIHEGKENVNPKTGEPYKSAGKRISYGPTAYIKDVFFAPRDQYKSLEMGIEPAKEPLQTVEGRWVNAAPADVAAKVKELMGQPGWVQVGFDPARHGYFYDRKTKRPVVRASEMYQIGNFLLAKDVEYAPKEQFLYSIEPIQEETPEFKRWFGDSKVVDESGEPLVVYHGTGREFSEFKRRPQFFSPNKMWARFHAEGDVERQAAAGRKYAGPVVMPVYLSLQDPMYLDGKSLPNGAYLDNYSEQVKEAKKLKHDGLVILNSEGGTEYVIFRPEQVKSATRNVGAFDPTSRNIFQSLQSAAVQPPISEQTRTPSLTRRVKTLNRQREDGRVNDQQFIKGVEEAIQQDDWAKVSKPVSERVRGADYIRQRLLEAKRRGDLSAEAVDFAEWFIRNNEALVDDLGITIRAPSERATAGMYNPLSRIMVLLKEAAGDTTVVHEILHHLERMMPAEVQGAIRKEWLGRFLRAKRAAKTPTEKLYFELLLNHHFGSGAASDVKLPAGMRQPTIPLEGSSYKIAIDMLRDGLVPVADYQYVNPSEFWAVNGTDIMQGRYNAIRGGVLARLKQWLKELGQRIKSIFGLRSDAPLIRALDSLARADGQFISAEMLMDGDTFLQIGKNIYGERPLVNWTSPDETKLDNFIYKLQDKYIDTKRVVQDIERAIGALDDKWNPYLQEELYHGRTATQTKDFLRYEVRPLLEAMKAENVSIGEFEEFLHNRFAPTRNDNIAKINPEMPDGGSGIFTEDAEAYMAALTPEQRSKYERLAGMVDDITKGTRDYLVQTGLEKQETIDGWESSSPNYVPLNREDVEYSLTVGTGTGRGFSVRGPSTRRATGSLRPVANVLANLVMQRERAIVRGEKNRVAVALYGLAMQNPSPKYWLAVNPDATKGRKALMNELVNMGLTQEDAEGLMQEPAQKVVDPRTGLVMTRVNPVLRGANNVVAARVNGKDRFVFFNTQDPRAARMAQAILNMDADQLSRFETWIASITRYFSSINTQYNPVFGIYNFLRDYQGGAIQLSGTPLEDSRWEVLNPQNVLGAMRGIYQTLRTDRDQGMQLMTPWSQLWIEFQGEGGQTGYRDMFSRSQERADALKKELDRLNEGPAKKAGLAVPRAVFNWLADYNETLENAVRLSAYKAALDKGLSKEQAASVAKNLTVNFNRKGTVGVRAGAWYSFFNSAVQGTTRLLQTVVKTEKPGDFKSLHLTKAGKVIVYGGLMAGVMQAMMMAAMGFDEKEPPDFVKDRNLIIPIGKGKYLAWPMPLGYHVIPAIGRIVTEWALSGFKNTTERVVHLADLLLDAFNPIGNAGLSMQSVLPTILDPAAAIFENQDWTGKPIAKEDFNKLDPTPGYTRAKQNASWVGEQVSYFLNVLSGGNADKPGAISPTPDQIDYLIGQATGGLGREILKATKTIKAGVTGEELPPYNIPLVGRFYGNTKAGYAEAQRFYDNLQELNVLQNQLEGRRKRNENPAEFIKENPKVRLAAAANAVQRNIQNLRKQRDALIEKGAPKERVQAVENNIKVQMQRFNEKLRQLEEATKSKKEPVAVE